jgi:hypothetical protein
MPSVSKEVVIVTSLKNRENVTFQERWIERHESEEGTFARSHIRVWRGCPIPTPET